ncbi:MAG TPA: tyrosine-type recombinase/integrase [Thermodesulfobacteriota bacterium]|nr:tyrosine-type recombinase/integrase [Thermodesulfobacteriota bacterium]
MAKPFKRWRKRKDGSKYAEWWIRYTVNGKDKWESVGKVGIVTKAVAQAKLEQRQRQVRLGQLDMIGAKIPTLQEFAPEYLSYVRDTVGKRSWKRDELSLTHLNSFLGDQKLSAITSKDILDYQSKRLKDRVKPATVNRELACLKHLFNVAKQKSQFFGENPVSKVKFLEENNQMARVLTPEEEERLLASSAPHLIPIILTAVRIGMRKSEILSLKWINVDLGNSAITVEPTNTKSKKLNRIPIGKRLREILLKQKLKTGFSEYVFLNPEGKPYQRHDSLKRCFQGALRRAGIKGLRFHDLRHTAATRMIERGSGIVEVSKMLGHSALSTTMRYAHPDNSLREAAENADNYTLTRSQIRSQEELEE